MVKIKAVKNLKVVLGWILVGVSFMMMLMIKLGHPMLSELGLLLQFWKEVLVAAVLGIVGAFCIFN